VTSQMLKCPAGCGGERKAGQMACPGCWRQVPAELKREVHRTWRAYCKTSTNAAFKEYCEVRDRALMAIP
jgi:hypothetical protein